MDDHSSNCDNMKGAKSGYKTLIGRTHVWWTGKER